MKKCILGPSMISNRLLNSISVDASFFKRLGSPLIVALPSGTWL
jgi:hypothetical protein